MKKLPPIEVPGKTPTERMDFIARAVLQESKPLSREVKPKHRKKAPRK
jgi:hypothetical protein